jgi:predicted O-linked N-acetylglucosamine transferase (SPINDLY family)
VRALHSYFGLHDKAKFDIVCYSGRAGDNSPERNRIVSGCNKGMIDISQLPFDEVQNMCPWCSCMLSPIMSTRSSLLFFPRAPYMQVAARIRAAGVHVLVDLTGYTITPRAEVFALRSAPVQLQVRSYPHKLVACSSSHSHALSVPWVPWHDGRKFH